MPQKYIDLYDSYFKKEQEPYEKQLHRIGHQNIFVGPGWFYSRSLFDEVGGFSSEYGNAEEWPFMYKILKAGNRIYAINRKLVRYRVSASSLSHQKDKHGLINKNLFEPLYRFYFDHPYRDMLKEHRRLEAYHYAVHFKTMRYCYRTNNSWLARTINRYYIYFSPYLYLKLLGVVR